MRKWQANQFIFLDESGINAWSDEWIYEWNYKKWVIKLKIPESKAENFIILSIMIIEKYIIYNIYQNFVNIKIFKDFIEQDLLFYYLLFLESWLIIIINNIFIYI